LRNNALTASRIGIFSSLYTALSLIPISAFIGAPSFLTLNLIVVPTIAILLNPLEAFFAGLFGGTIAFYIAPFQAMFGSFTILLPVAGSTFGSLAFHKGEGGAAAALAFLALSIFSYLIRNFPFPYFVAPHLAAMIVTLITFFRKEYPLRLKIAIYAFVSTMCEQGAMMILAVHLLGLPWQTFIGILPLMIYERLIGTVGATVLSISLARAAPKYFS